MDEDSVYSEENPSGLIVNFFKFTRSDWKLNWAFIALFFIAGSFLGSFGQVGVVVLWVALLWRQNKARHYRLIVRGLKGVIRHLFRDGQVWKATGQPVQLVEDDTADPEDGEVEVEDGPIPFQITTLPLGHGRGDIAVLYSPKDHVLSIVFVGRGSSIGAQSLRGQSSVYGTFEMMTKRAVMQQRGYSLGLSYVLRFDPFDEPALQLALDNLLLPETAFPRAALMTEEQRKEATIEEKRALSNAVPWAEMKEIMPDHGCKTWMATVVSIRREGVFAQAQESGFIDQKSLRNLPLSDIVDTVLNGLKQCGVTDAAVLDEAAAQAYIRGSWDVIDIADFYELALTEPEDLDPETIVALEGLHWPQEGIRQSRKSSDIDGNVATVLRITGAPEQVWQGFWREEFMAALPNALADSEGRIQYPSIALIGEAAKSDREVHWIEVGTNFVEAIREFLGIVETRKSQAREARMKRRGDSIFASKFSQSYSILVVLRPTDFEDLDRQVSLCKRFAQGLDLSVEVIAGGEYQFPARWSGTTGLNLL